jgi:hypothetical protein
VFHIIFVLTLNQHWHYIFHSVITSHYTNVANY